MMEAAESGSSPGHAHHIANQQQGTRPSTEWPFTALSLAPSLSTKAQSQRSRTFEGSKADSRKQKSGVLNLFQIVTRPALQTCNKFPTPGKTKTTIFSAHTCPKYKLHAQRGAFVHSVSKEFTRDLSGSAAPNGIDPSPVAVALCRIGD